MNIEEATTLSNGPSLQLIEWLQAHHVLPDPLRCLPCQRDFILTARNVEHVDGYLWRCAGCRSRKSLRTGSFFNEFPRTPLGKLLMLVYLWSERELRTRAARTLNMTKNSVGNVYAVLRHYCGRDLEDRPIIPFGGHVCIMKCDESKSKRGRRARRSKWLFGVLSTENTPCRGYFQEVPRRDWATVAPILHRVLLPGSELHSDDCWPGYRNLTAHVPNVTLHQVEDQLQGRGQDFLGTHTQEAEAAWSRLKYHMKREKGIRSEDVQGFLNEQMWRDWRGLGDEFNNIIRVVSQYYPF